jgi:hypothetical protein
MAGDGQGSEDATDGEDVHRGEESDQEAKPLERQWAGGDELQIMVMREKLEAQLMRDRIKSKPVCVVGLVPRDALFVSCSSRCSFLVLCR